MKNYNEFVITDGTVSLFRNKSISENADLSISQAECFDIVLNTTEEVVGIISYRYNNNSNYIDYGGNVNYRIKAEYRGNGYAKMAFMLMIEILKKNTKFEQPLYVASTLYNEDYLNVAVECGGKLIHSGQVPDNVVSSYYDCEMKNVSVYRIDIDKVSNKKR